MKPYLVYALKLKLRLRALDKEMDRLKREAPTTEPKRLVQSLAKYAELKREKGHHTVLMRSMVSRFGIVWW